jgi:uncharacterized protein (UPF0332 family)
MMEERYKEALKALEKARAAVRNAEYNLAGGFYAPVANRAYYACYYCMVAALCTRNIYSKTHVGARSKFAELFIKTAIFPISVSDSIALLFEYRQTADYDLDENITEEEAGMLVKKATEIYFLTNAWLQNVVNLLC